MPRYPFCRALTLDQEKRVRDMAVAIMSSAHLKRRYRVYSDEDHYTVELTLNVPIPSEDVEIEEWDKP